MSEHVPSFIVVGLPNRANFIPRSNVRRVMESNSLFVGSERLRAIIAHWLPPGHRWQPLGKTSALMETARSLGEPIVVFASGDPLFYGVAAALRTADPSAHIRVLPWFNSLQLLCHRLVLPYADIVSASVHGRDWHELDSALLCGNRLIGVLTDAEHTPAAVARRLLEYGFTQYTVHVGEALESPAERVRTLTIAEAASGDFNMLSCVILAAPERHVPAIGLDETTLEGLPGRPDMITKMPVRLASLARLDLARRHCLWDIGSCTGSVSIEARRQNPNLCVIAFEKRPACATLLERNARAFGAPGIQALIGDFFEQPLAPLPAPDAVFVGGHGGRLDELLARIDTVLAPGARIVLNAVLDTSRADFESAVVHFGYRPLPPIRLQVDDHNPIAVLAAEKPAAAKPEVRQ